MHIGMEKDSIADCSALWAARFPFNHEQNAYQVAWRLRLLVPFVFFTRAAVPINIDCQAGLDRCLRAICKGGRERTVPTYSELASRPLGRLLIQRHSLYLETRHPPTWQRTLEVDHLGRQVKIRLWLQLVASYVRSHVELHYHNALILVIRRENTE